MKIRFSDILGMNARNFLYLQPWNDKKSRIFADNKLKSKLYLGSRGIPVPKIYTSFTTIHEVRGFDFASLPDSFVVKPNHGYGGMGILVVDQNQLREQGYLSLVSGERITYKELYDHILDIMDGNFSLSGIPDQVLIEQRIVPHAFFAELGAVGLPDIRIIVHNLVPVMAMVRVPTTASKGRANLSSGAFAIGIDIGTGALNNIFYQDQIVSYLPGTKKKIRGLKIPYWGEILLTAVRTQPLSNVGYMAVDFSIDEKLGPVLLEINARGGLKIQLVNKSPLLPRLQKVKGLKVLTPEQGVELGKTLFAKTGAETRKDAMVYRKTIIGVQEVAKIFLADNTYQKIPVKVTPARKSSWLDFGKALELGLAVKTDPLGKIIRVKLELAGKKINTAVVLKDLEDKGYVLNLGYQDLGAYLVDPSLSQRRSDVLVSTDSTARPVNLRLADRILADIDREMMLLYYLRPINLSEEKKKFFTDPKKTYSPRFIYPDLKFDPKAKRQALKKIKLDSSPLGQILEKKRIEIERKISLLEARGDARKLTQASMKLYGKPDKALLLQAREIVQNLPTDFIDNERLSATDALKIFEKAVRKYRLYHKVVIADIISACSIGPLTINIRPDARFSAGRVRGLIAHEIETHLFCRENGVLQAYRIFESGMAGYLFTQEGLANWMGSQAHDTRQQSYFTASSFLAVESARTRSFREVYDEVYAREKNQQNAWKIALKVKRGISDTREAGANTRQIIYFTGMQMIEDFVKSGGDLRRLYIGRVAVEDLDLAEQIPGLSLPRFLPDSLR